MKLFAEPGGVNTRETIELGIAAAKERGIEHLVVPSVTGGSARLFLPYRGQFELIIVSHAPGYEVPGENQMPAAIRAELIEGGCRVITTTHVLSGAERGLSSKFTGVYPVELIAHALRMLGQGLKVAVEVAVMALDSGAIPYGQDVMCFGGNGKNGGLDTAAVIRPSHAATILDTHVSELICQPR